MYGCDKRACVVVFVVVVAVGVVPIVATGWLFVCAWSDKIPGEMRVSSDGHRVANLVPLVCRRRPVAVGPTSSAEETLVERTGTSLSGRQIH